MENNIIEFNNLTKDFKKLRAVDNITFYVPRGSIFGFLGPNGSGKSTTIRMLCGVISPTSGDGKVLGYNIQKDAEKVKKKIGYMSQKFSLYEDLTVKENLEFYGGIYGLDNGKIKEKAKYLLEMAGLVGREKQLAGNLSGGWKQRLALGCALIHEPELLILDEPTAGVDPVSRRIFWHIIKELNKTGITILVTTHYMDEAMNCDMTAFIFNGKILAFDKTKEILKLHNTDNLENVFIKYVEQQTGKKIIDTINAM